MKELSIEEKAKLYDKAIKRAKAYQGLKSEMEIIFHELKESEDKKPNGAIVIEDFNEGNGFYKVNLAHLNKEQVEDIENIIKRWNAQKYDEEAIRDCIGVILTDAPEQRFVDFNTSLKDCLVWLKRQSENGTNENNREIPFSEQNLAEKIDALMSLDEAIEHCKEKSCGNNACALEHKQLEKWLTELKELKEQKSYASETMDEKGDFDNGFTRMMEKEQNHAWSEVDKEMSRFIGNAITADDASMYLKSKGIQVIDVHVWLEKLKERVQSQNTWRPSDEQMEALGTYIYNPQYFNSLDPRMELVESVYKDLKKLKKNIETI